MSELETTSPAFEGCGCLIASVEFLNGNDLQPDCVFSTAEGRRTMGERDLRRAAARLAGGTAAAAFAVGLTALGVAAPAAAQEKKPNILFIMGDDIGWMQPSIYHEGLMVGETPNIDRIMRARSSWTTSPCRAARRDAMPSSPACTRCAPA
jgi:hypothetical protein